MNETGRYISAARIGVRQFRSFSWNETKGKLFTKITVKTQNTVGATPFRSSGMLDSINWPGNAAAFRIPVALG